MQCVVNDICCEIELVEGFGCIFCGMKMVFVWYVGYYRVMVVVGYLCFICFNIYFQCDVCNVYKLGNIEVYCIVLVECYGEVVVLVFENNNILYCWMVEELKEVRFVVLVDLCVLKKLEVV